MSIAIPESAEISITGLRYIEAGVRRYALGNGREIAYSPSTGEVRVLSSHAGALLTACAGLRTNTQHLDHLCTKLRLPGEMRGSISSLLAELEQSELLLPATRLYRDQVGTEQRQIGTDECPSMTSVGIVTAGRELMMERCLGSFLQYSATRRPHVSFTIVDDSPDAEVRNARRRYLAALARQTRANISYAGAEEKQDFVEHLAAQGIPSVISRFGLLDTEHCGHSAGANRNALLLGHAGEAFFQVDDDIVCQVTQPEGVQDKWRFTCDGNPNRFWYFEHAGMARRGLTESDVDLLMAHEQMLGRSLTHCFANAPISENATLSDNILDLALTGRGRISITQNGLVGDCGFGSCSPYLFFRGGLREDLHSCEKTYRLATASREIRQTVLEPTVSDGAFCMSYALGIDNRQMLPPFFPVRRNGDSVFGTLVRACVPESLFAHVPVQLVHDPPQPRQYRWPVWKLPERELANIVIQLIRSFPMGPVTESSRRISMLGCYMVDVSAVDTTTFRRFLCQQALVSAAALSFEIHRLLKDYERQPSYWSADCDRYIEDLEAMVGHPDVGIPGDLSATRSATEAVMLVQKLVRKFGELLIAWSSMVEAAKYLRTKGITLARAM